MSRAFVTAIGKYSRQFPVKWMARSPAAAGDVKLPMKTPKSPSVGKLQ